MNCQEIQANVYRIKENVEKVIIGKSNLIDLVLTALLSKGHILLEDVPGTGKTMLAKSIAKSVDASFHRIQFTPDLLPSDVTGLNYFSQKQNDFIFRPGPVFTNILLADEINRATARTQSSLLECMEERQITIDGETRVLDTPFLVIATQNPVETAGTFPLPEAQLDRFIMQLHMGLPSKEEEISILNRYILNTPIDTLESVCTKESLVEMQTFIPTVKIHPLIMDYIVSIILQTRQNQNITFGVSPRGSLALMRCSQAYAAIGGRNYVIPEDVKTLAPYVLSHRLVMSRSFLRSSSSFDIMNQILEEVPVPTEDFS